MPRKFGVREKDTQNWKPRTLTTPEQARDSEANQSGVAPRMVGGGLANTGNVVKRVNKKYINLFRP